MNDAGTKPISAYVSKNLEKRSAHFAGEEQIKWQIKGRVEDERGEVESGHPSARLNARHHQDALDHHRQLAEHVEESDGGHQILKIRRF